MMAAAKTHDSAVTGQRFVAEIARRAWDELSICLDDAVKFRALTPNGLRSAADRASAASYVQKWFGAPDQLALLSSEIQPMHDRLCISYRFRAQRPMISDRTAKILFSPGWTDQAD